MALVLESVTVEPMRLTDVPVVSAIDRLCYPVPWDPHAYETELGNRSACYLVARVDGEIVGYAGMWVVMDEAHVTTLAVAPEHRRKGIGERLLVALIEEAIWRGAIRASLEVREHNHVAQTLYRKHGFRTAAVRKRYYSDNQENALVMWADDLGTEECSRRLTDARERLAMSGNDRSGV
jgi:ribosomal-protein-alanine N-acetyltransferase